MRLYWARLRGTGHPKCAELLTRFNSDDTPGHLMEWCLTESPLAPTRVSFKLGLAGAVQQYAGKTEKS